MTRPITPTMQYALALDVGGTNIRAALVDAHGAIAQSMESPTHAIRGGAAVVETMRELAGRLCERIDPSALVGIGISAAGVIDPITHTVIDATDAIPGWRGTNLSAVFRDTLKQDAVADNDVKCALRGEAWCGAARERTTGTVVMMTLGTGLGGAWMHNGVVVSGTHHVAGHIGRMLATADAAVESVVSGTGLAALHANEFANEPANGPISRRQQAAGEVIMQRAAAGEAHARRAVDRWLDALALQLVNVYWMLDPACVIIGGGVIDSRDVWWSPLCERLRAAGVPLTVVPAALGNRAGVVGAALLVWRAREGHTHA
jgi:glucokinase